MMAVDSQVWVIRENTASAGLLQDYLLWWKSAAMSGGTQAALRKSPYGKEQRPPANNNTNLPGMWVSHLGS